MCPSRSRRNRRDPSCTRAAGNVRARRHVRLARRAIAGSLILGALPAGPACAGAGNTAAAMATDTAQGALAPTLAMMPTPSTPSPLDESLLLAVRVNGVDRDDTVRVLRAGSRVFLSLADWGALHLRAATGQVRHVDGQDYAALDLPGLRWRLDDSSQTLVIDATSAAFAGTTLRMDVAANAQSLAPSLGAYANYDVEVQRGVAGTGSNQPQTASALLEVGAFGVGRGSVSSTGLLLDTGAGTKAVRLDTTWTRDLPGKLSSVRVGDAVNRPGAWGNAIRFAGLQWATDFSLQPGLLTFPLPSVKGEAALPSTVDVYINNSKRLQGDVAPGPFDLTELPIVTGSGEVRLVVHDALGREQVITQPYYVSPSLLKPGLDSYSYEIGAVRQDYGLADAHYDSLIASATDRLGITAGFTRELRAEAQPDHVAAGATGIWLLPSVGLASASAIASMAHGLAGGALMASLERQSANWNGSVQVRGNTANFVEAGQTSTTARLQSSVALGGSIGNTPVGLSYILQVPYSGTPTRLLSFNVSHGIGHFGSIAFFALRDFTTASTTLSVSMSVALDGRSSVALSGTRSSVGNDRGSNQVQYQRTLPEDDGIGLQLSAANGQSRQATGQVFGRTGWADLNAGVSRSNDQTDVRAGASGAFAWMDDSVFATRHIDGSFAVVEVGDYPNVAVTRDHHEVARTDASGRALVSGLRGYEVNRIGAEPADLPFDASVDALDVEFVPPTHAGVVLRMPIKRSRSATFKVVGGDGMPLPAGTQLMLAGRDTTYPVGFDGRSFIAGLAGSTVVRAHGAAGDCHFMIAVPPGEADDLPDLGTQRCL